jgi:putative phosphoesterase
VSTEPVVIGLISDTHNLVRPSVHAALAGVSVILHAGDVGEPMVLAELGTIAPVHAVFGNTDEWYEPLVSSFVYRVGDVRIHVSHGHELGSPTPDKLLAAYPEEVLVYGHTHKQLVTRAEGRLVVNPGAAGPRRFHLVPSVARLTVASGEVSVQLIDLMGAG